MGLADDRVMQHHLAYFVGQAWVWIACVLVMGADLHKTEISGFTTKYYQDRAQTSGAGGSVRYKDCSASSICDECAKGGAGAVAMAVFCWLGATVLIIQRALFLAQKWQSIPWLGDSAVRWGWVERGTNIWCVVTLFFSIIAWGVGCIREVAKSTTVTPTAYVFVVMAVVVSGLCTALIWIIHVETDFMSGGSASGSASSGTAAASSAPPAKSMQPMGASAGAGLDTDNAAPAQPSRGPPPRPPSHAMNPDAGDNAV